MKEIWKDIKGYEYKYQISNLGNVRIKENVTVRMNMGKLREYKQKSKLMKPTNNGYGYLKVSLKCENGIIKNNYIHKLVANNFIINNSNYPVVNHIDGNKLNNRIDNLEWCTYKENSIHMFEVLKFKPNTTGINKPRQVLKLDINTLEVLEEFETITEAYRKTGICHISSVCRNVRKSAGGFSWKYKI